MLQEESEMIGHRVVLAEQVRQGRPIRTRRVRSLERLVELLRIAEEDE